MDDSSTSDSSDDGPDTRPLRFLQSEITPTILTKVTCEDSVLVSFDDGYFYLGKVVKSRKYKECSKYFVRFPYDEDCNWYTCNELFALPDGIDPLERSPTSRRKKRRPSQFRPLLSLTPPRWTLHLPLLRNVVQCRQPLLLLRSPPRVYQHEALLLVKSRCSFH